MVAPKERPRPEPVSRYGDIVDVAAELFATKGYAATSIQDIADAVGILKGSLYHYINTKEDLLVSVVDEVHRHTGETIEAVGTVDGDAAVKLAVFVEWHLAPTDRDVAKARVFFSEFAQLSPERAEGVQRRRDEYERTLRAIIREGQEQGIFAAHLDPVLTGMAIFGVLNLVPMWYRPGGPRTMAEITTAFQDIILRSVRADAAGATDFGVGRAHISASSDAKTGASEKEMPAS